ncbi:MAG: FmdB family zinc ribbon protein [Fluviibacter sp.]
MPMYDFRCTTCTHEWTEHRLIANRDTETFCPTCTNPYIIRIYKGQRVAIIYKTDGFYTTDKGK